MLVFTRKSIWPSASWRRMVEENAVVVRRPADVELVIPVHRLNTETASSTLAVIQPGSFTPSADAR